MLAIRMQRTGRKGHAMYRVVVQDSRLTPTSGKIVAQLGSYDPHKKSITLDKEKATFYLDHGAQPSDRVAGLFKNDGIKLPAWVKQSAKKERVVRNPEKRRSTRPEEPEAPEAEAEPVAESAEESSTEAANESETAEDNTSSANKPSEESTETEKSEEAVSEDEIPA